MFTKAIPQCLRGSMWRRRTELWTTRKCFLQHDKARPHTALSVKELLSAACVMFSIFVTMRYFLIPTTETSIERPSICWYSGSSEGHDKRTLQHSRKCFPILLQRPPATLGSGVMMQEELFRKTYLAPECKYAMLIFIPSVSELPGRRLYVRSVCSSICT